MTRIDPLASVHPNARIGDDVVVGPFTVIEEGAVIGDGCNIGPDVLITKWARLGNELKISKGAVIGTDPQDLKFGEEETTLEVGDRTVIREFATLNRGTHASGKTVIGKDCLLMAYTHVGHDCRVGDNVILSNGVNLAGHVEMDDFVIVGGMTGFHQFIHVGKHCFIGGMSKVRQDVPPYIRAADEPLDYAGVNSIGLRRRGMSSESIMSLKRAYKILYRSGLNVSQALEELKKKVESAEVEEVIRFIENRSDRGMMGRSKAIKG